jgi:glycerol-3-phosphate dehydrogenase (NAD(P)+)
LARVGILGAGAWGTALALVAARAGHRVALVARDSAAAEAIRTAGANPRLPGAALPEAVAVCEDPGALAAADLVLLVVPTQALRQAAARLPPLAGPVLLGAKGLELGSGLRPSEVVAAVRPGLEVGALSGPSFAAEVAAGRPTAVSLAFAGLATARQAARLLALPAFRPYPSDDLPGVELGGALKNVVAIAAGIVLGRGLGENARAALVTRGLAEMARLAEALGARRATLMGLSGLGDLVLTATSLASRNTSLGFALGRGAAPAELLGAGRALAEGAFTAEAACTLAARHGLDLPITDAVRRVVAGLTSIDAAIEELLARPLPESE